MLAHEIAVGEMRSSRAGYAAFAGAAVRPACHFHSA